MAKWSRDARKEAVGDGHELTWNSVSILGETLKDQGRCDEAKKLFVEVMESRKQKLGLDHPDTLTSMANLDHTWYAQERLIEAGRRLERIQLPTKVECCRARPSTHILILPVIPGMLSKQYCLFQL